MPKKDIDDSFILSEHGNWNVASDYSRLKIMKQLYLADEYETIATFGFIDILEESNTDVNKDVLRLRGMKRLIKTLIMLIDNTIFAVKSKEKEKLDGLRKELLRFWKVVPSLHEYKVNQKEKTRELKLKDNLFNDALERIIEIKSEINEPLNKYDLIFTHKEDFDIKKYKDQIMQGAVDRG